MHRVCFLLVLAGCGLALPFDRDSDGLDGDLVCEIRRAPASLESLDVLELVTATEGTWEIGWESAAPGVGSGFDVAVLEIVNAERETTAEGCGHEGLRVDVRVALESEWFQRDPIVVSVFDALDLPHPLMRFSTPVQPMGSLEETVGAAEVYLALGMDAVLTADDETLARCSWCLVAP